MAKELICNVCGGPREIGRRQCRECYLQAKRFRESQRYALQGPKLYLIECEACHTIFQNERKNRRICTNCRNEVNKLNNSRNTYQYKYDGKEIWAHRTIAEATLQKQLTYNEVVHHADGDTTNNALSNLWVLWRGNHLKLHSYLRTEQIIYLKNKQNYQEKEWKDRQILLSNIFIKEHNLNVIKLSEV